MSGARAVQIEMIRRKFGYFPRTFNLCGEEHEVTSVTRCWTTGSRKMNRHYFDVVCAAGNFTLYQDLGSNTWHAVCTTGSKAVVR